MDGDLGFELDCRACGGLDGPAVLFGYTHGLKARWAGLDDRGKRKIRWVAGGPGGQCWRQSLLRKDHQLVVITEGETDTMAALSAGFEGDRCLVIGLAGATILPLVQPFASRDVLIMRDPGEAGERSSAALQQILSPVALSLTSIEGRAR